jgi:hypothetical protein
MRSVYRVGLWLPVFGILAVLLGACGAFSGGANVNDLETRNAQLQSTIESIGTPAATLAALKMTADRGIVLQAELANIQGTALALQATLAVVQGGGAGIVAAPTSAPAPAVPGGQAPAGQAPTQIDPASAAGGGQPGVTPAASSGTTFSQTTTATDRDSQDCPLGATSVFDATEDTIYVITRVSELRAGSTLSARWLNNGQVYFDDTECWIPDQDWFNICAYCSIVPDEATFPTGSWSVELLLDGQLMSQAQFQVTDNSGTDDTMSDEEAGTTG